MRRSGFSTFLLLVCLGFSGEWALFADSGKPSGDTPTFSLSLCQLGGEPLPQLYWMKMKKDADGNSVPEYLPLDLPNGMRSAPVEIPLVPPPKIYTGRIHSDGKPEVNPFLEIPAKSPKEKLLLVLYLDPQGKQQQTFLDDSATAHAPGAVRVINLSGGRIAFNTGASQPIIVSPGSQAIAVPKADLEKRFPFEYFSDLPGQAPYHSPVQMLRMREPGGRLLVIFSTSLQNERGERSDLPATPQNLALVPVPTRLPDSVAISERAEAKSAVVKVSGAPPTSPVKQVPNRQIAVLSLVALPAEGSVELTSGDTHVHAQLKPRTLKTIPVPGGAASEVALHSGGECLAKVLDSGSSLQHLIILLSNPPGEKWFKAIIVENSLQSHPNGQPRLFNLTPFELGYAVGKTIVRVNPFQDSLIQNPSPETAVGWKVAVKTPEGWKLIEEKPFEIASPEARPCLFVYQDPEDRQFKLLEQIQ